MGSVTHGNWQYSGGGSANGFETVFARRTAWFPVGFSRLKGRESCLREV